MKFSSCIVLFLLFLNTALIAQNNPAPLLNQPLLPASARPGGSGLTLTVNGTGFVPGAVLQWNGLARTTTVLSSSSLQATIPAADLARPDTASITVVNPAPGGGASNIVYFPIRGTAATVVMSRSDTLTVPGSVAVGDFNNDGNIDIAVGQPSAGGGGTIFLYLGKGDGTFLGPHQFTSPVGPSQLIAADFTQDGALDLAASDKAFGDEGLFQTAIFLGDGKGGLRARAQTIPGALEGVADFNGDGSPDLILWEIDKQGYRSDAYLGHGDGSFTRSQLALGAAQLLIWGNAAVGDFNRDGKLDVAFNGSVCLGNGDGTFQPFLATPATGRSIVTADINGDGKLDLISDSVKVALGNGDGTFTESTGFSLERKFSDFSVMGDFNGDGTLDLALEPAKQLARVINQGVMILLGRTDGTFHAPISFTSELGGYPPWGFAAADFNHDGRLDLIFGRETTTEIYMQQKP